MKFSLAFAPLLALGVIAAPSANPQDVSAPRDAEGSVLEARDKKCKISGADKVNCRSGPSTLYSVTKSLSKGSSYTFGCFVTGERVVLDGVSNASWQYIPSLNCYVNGWYTDSACTSAALGRCIWDW